MLDLKREIMKIRCTILILRVINHWSKLLRGIVDSLSVGVLKSILDSFLKGTF